MLRLRPNLEPVRDCELERLSSGLLDGALELLVSLFVEGLALVRENSQLVRLLEDDAGAIGDVARSMPGSGVSGGM